MQRPSIDHTILSPSGKCSKRAREAALKREADRLFPKGYFDAPEKSDREIAGERVISLRRSAQNLLDLAGRGMCRALYTRKAEQLNREADNLEESFK